MFTLFANCSFFAQSYQRLENNNAEGALSYISSSPLSATISYSKNSINDNFAHVIPSTGVFGTETTFVSSQTDLGETNSLLDVYSVDYYQGTNRVASVLATSTVNGINGHSKAICDRLNNSTLEDIRTIQLNEYEIIMAKIKRANGEVAVALNFSVQQLSNENKLHSYWNNIRYPSGNYLNFQVWGSSIDQVCSITNYILMQFKLQKPLNEAVVSNRVPSVFANKGFYKNGQLNLKLANKSNVSSLIFSENKKTAQISASENSIQNITLSAALEQDIFIATGGLFDIGFTIQENNTKHLADGSWGANYLNTETVIDQLSIENSTNLVKAKEYRIERNIAVAGQVFGTVNLFRNFLPGELSFDASAYSSVQFSLQNSLPVEVILVTENITNWNNRLRILLPANAKTADFNIALSNFTNALGQTLTNEKIKGFVFSTIGNYAAFQPFSIALSNLKLGGTALVNSNFNISVATKMYNYPNPCRESTTIVLPKKCTNAIVSIVDIFGKIIQNKSYDLTSNEISINFSGLTAGIYFFEVTTNDDDKYTTKFVKK